MMLHVSEYQCQLGLCIQPSLQCLGISPFPMYSYLSKGSYMPLGKEWTYYYHVHMPGCWNVLPSGDLTSHEVDGFHVQKLAKT